MTEPTCKTCRFWILSNEEHQYGECHKKAPSAVPHQLIEDEEGKAWHDTLWPSTDSMDWCGEHEPTPSAPVTPSAIPDEQDTGFASRGWVRYAIREALMNKPEGTPSGSAGTQGTAAERIFREGIERQRREDEGPARAR